jgi:hypothetical protein
LSRVEASRLWREFYIQVPPIVTEIFEAATSSTVGDGATTFFWLDNWLPDGRLKDLAPHLFVLIPKSLSRGRLVKDALDGGWLDDIPLTLMLPRLRSCWRSWTVWRDLPAPRVWQMCSGGIGCQRYLLREVLLSWACSVETWPWRARYRSGSPMRRPSVGFFSGWCCMIGAGLRIDWSNVGLRPLACPFCDQTQESITHLLLGCVLARSVWALVYVGGIEGTVFRHS